jgi:hypothetical protein
MVHDGRRTTISAAVAQLITLYAAQAARQILVMPLALRDSCREIPSQLGTTESRALRLVRECAQLESDQRRLSEGDPDSALRREMPRPVGSSLSCRGLHGC